MSPAVACPHCNVASPFDAFDLTEAATLVCPKCGTKFNLTAILAPPEAGAEEPEGAGRPPRPRVPGRPPTGPVAPAPPAAGGLPSSPPAPVGAKPPLAAGCQKCGAKWLGEAGKCARCSSTDVVPLDESAEGIVAEAIAAVERGEDLEQAVGRLLGESQAAHLCPNCKSPMVANRCILCKEDVPDNRLTEDGPMEDKIGPIVHAVAEGRMDPKAATIAILRLITTQIGPDRLGPPRPLRRESKAARLCPTCSGPLDPTNYCYFCNVTVPEGRLTERKRGCPGCGSTCGVPGCLVCAGKGLCNQCRNKQAQGIPLKHTGEAVVSHAADNPLTESLLSVAEAVAAAHGHKLGRWVERQGITESQCSICNAAAACNADDLWGPAITESCNEALPVSAGQVDSLKSARYLFQGMGVEIHEGGSDYFKVHLDVEDAIDALRDKGFQTKSAGGAWGTTVVSRGETVVGLIRGPLRWCIVTVRHLGEGLVEAETKTWCGSFADFNTKLQSAHEELGLKGDLGKLVGGLQDAGALKITTKKGEEIVLKLDALSKALQAAADEGFESDLSDSLPAALAAGSPPPKGEEEIEDEAMPPMPPMPPSPVAPPPHREPAPEPMPPMPTPEPTDVAKIGTVIAKYFR